MAIFKTVTCVSYSNIWDHMYPGEWCPIIWQKNSSVQGEHMPSSSVFQEPTEKVASSSPPLIQWTPHSSKEATLCSSELLVPNSQTTWCHSPEKHYLNLQCCKTLTLIWAEAGAVSVELSYTWKTSRLNLNHITDFLTENIQGFAQPLQANTRTAPSNKT